MESLKNQFKTTTVLSIPVLFLITLFPVIALAGLDNRSGPGKTFNDLPLPARYAVSEAVGRDRSCYHVNKKDSGLQAVNQSNSYNMSFSQKGLEVQSGADKWGLILTGWGYGDSRQAVGPARPRATANRVEYRRGALTEWYINGPLGLQQGFTLKSPPKREKQADGFLRICLEMCGGLTAKVNQNRRSLSVHGRNGRAVFHYGGLTVIDAGGRELNSWLEVKADRLFINVDDRCARYPLMIDPFIQSTKLTASDGKRKDYFGGSVSASGNVIVVGASGDDDNGDSSGSAYVFVQPEDGWSAGLTETAKLTASDGEDYDSFGYSVSISGDVIVVGASGDDDNGDSSGSAYVFVKPVGGWSGALTETAKLTASDGDDNDCFGYSVSISGDVIVVGASGDDDNGGSSGSAYVVVKPVGGWSGALTETSKLTASDGDDNDDFGYSVSISGDVIVVGASGDDDNGDSSGSAYVFVKPVGGWSGGLTETAKLTASDGDDNDHFGHSVSISRNTIAAGAYGDNGNGDSSGSAYVFVKPVGGWSGALTETAKLTASDGGNYDLFGYSVSISGNTIVVGAIQDLVKRIITGSAYVFVRPEGGWSGGLTETSKLTASDGDAYDNFGRDVSVSGKTIVVGSCWDDDNGSDSGSAYIFEDQDGATIIGNCFINTLF